MIVDHFKEMYIAELQELRSVEDQLTRALPKMAEEAQHPALKEALSKHLDETTAQLERLDRILAKEGVEPREHEDESMWSIINEADRWVKMVGDGGLRDAAIIASAQRVEHYEIAVYGTLATWSKGLGREDDLKDLLESLQQEKHSDEVLSALAKQVINPEAFMV
ncbi:ferritin-like metal-binding protein YciE [Nitrobacteraceae bacterium AZCC 1564]